MKNVFCLAAGVFAAILAMPAGAQTTASPPAPAATPAPAEPPPQSFVSRLELAPYLGLGVGGATTSGIAGTAPDGVIITGDGTKVSYNGLAGVQIRQYWGLELQFSDLGNRHVAGSFGSVTGSGSASADQFSLAGTGTYPLSDGFSFIGKLGASRNHMGGQDFCVSAYCTHMVGSHTDLMWGVGLDYNLARHLVIRGEYENFGRFSTNGGPNGGLQLSGLPTGGSIRADNFALDLVFAF